MKKYAIADVELRFFENASSPYPKAQSADTSIAQPEMEMVVDGDDCEMLSRPMISTDTAKGINCNTGNDKPIEIKTNIDDRIAQETTNTVAMIRMRLSRRAMCLLVIH